jgi:2-hydroxycyclohexanecarboxyl-CoA dehydrogenase
VSTSFDRRQGTLRGGVAVVTGGAGTAAGLGQGLVRRLAAEGMRVAILDMNGAAAESLAETLRSEGADATACAVDIRDHDSLRAAAERLRATYGACNVLCAHVGVGVFGPLDEIRMEQWRDGFEVMVVGTIATVRSFLPLMRETDGLRRIVLTASVAALAPGRYQGVYRAAKAAVTSMGETLDLELGPEGIGTTIVFPSGMAPVMPAGASSNEAASRGQAASMKRLGPYAAAIRAEFAADPSDLTTGLSAAAPVIDAIVARRRYVITHGATAERTYRQRQGLLDEAFDELARRQYRATPPA